jgi:hypothetical protein
VNTSIVDYVNTFTAALREELGPMLEAKGFEWIGPRRYTMFYGKTGGEYFRPFEGGWQSVDLVVNTESSEVKIDIQVRARLNAFDELWMETVLNRPDEIDSYLSTVCVNLGNYLYQWAIPTDENYPAPPRTPTREKFNNVSFYATDPEHARQLARDFFRAPLEQTLVPLILRCESAADFVAAGRTNRYFTPEHAAHEYVLAWLAGDQEALSALIAKHHGKEEPGFDKAVSILG